VTYNNAVPFFFLIFR